MEGGKALPRQAGDVKQVRRRLRAALHPPIFPVGLHVLDAPAVKGLEIRVVLAPKGGEGLVLRVEHRVGGPDLFIIPGLSLGVPVHAELRVPVDHLGQRPDERRVKPQAPLLQPGQQPGQVQVHRHAVPTGDPLQVMLVMLPAGPGLQRDRVKLHMVSFLLLYRISGFKSRSGFPAWTEPAV